MPEKGGLSREFDSLLMLAQNSLKNAKQYHGEIEKIMSNFKLADAKVLGFLKVGCDAKARKSYKNGYYSYQYY